MKVEIEIPDEDVKTLGDLLESVGIDRCKVADVIRQNANETASMAALDEGFIVDGYVFANARAAARAASLLLAKYPGSPGRELHYCAGRKVVARWFPNRRSRARH